MMHPDLLPCLDTVQLIINLVTPVTPGFYYDLDSYLISLITAELLSCNCNILNIHVHG